MTMKTMVNVFDINRQKLIGKYPVANLEEKYDSWRAKGYSVCVDIDGDICIDDEDSNDDGKYYEEQIKSK